ncbi:hypothetical protein DWB85_16345 [Seongchinamella sediminis]|uniref:VOC domain-containing protein n=1 Tax=Seongchinamella sediminis TaxID=2283635 RepID=A0A3L7DVX5_9GAMM|nr:VOC family protein [Seongchinamella sediminis]RLQ20699.1 hypothetical protein DWB85_16345 [Seongchinamella sediminis]
MTPQFTGIDHVHLYVPRRDEAADWYMQVLDFRVVADAANQGELS